MITMPCPFCGERERLYLQCYVTGGTFVWCATCDARGPLNVEEDSDRAIADWDRRNVTGTVHPLPSIES